MTNSLLDRVYQASGDTEMREIYDKWADEYDNDVEGNGYLTPQRVAEALAGFVPQMDTPIMDYGCGTGLSGEALKSAGFSTLDGADLSQKMLDIAQEREIYRDLDLIEPNQPPSKSLGEYDAIAAVGVISKGAAPPPVYGELLNVMKPGAKLAFSMNDLSLSDPEYAGLVDESVEAGLVDLLAKEHGPHLQKYGKNSGSTVFVLERRA